MHKLVDYTLFICFFTTHICTSDVEESISSALRAVFKEIKKNSPHHRREFNEATPVRNTICTFLEERSRAKAIKDGTGKREK